MLIQSAIKLIQSIPDSWVRVDQLRTVAGRLEVNFTIRNGKRGTKVEGWITTCHEVREINITDLDGGGLAVYPSTHPAARQYVARWAELRWSRNCDETRLLAELYKAHVAAVDDWIPFDRYLQINTPWNGTSYLPYFAPVSGNKFVCRGPDFLLRAYSRALESIGDKAEFTLRGRAKSKTVKPKVLHFGRSHIVADSFVSQRLT